MAFIDPRGSQVDIVQAVGRAIRLSEDKTVGTIVLPVFIEDGDNAETSMQSSHFKPIWNVINALKSHDEQLSFELDKFRTALGKKSGASNNFGDFSKIIVDLPQTIDASFADSLKTYLVEKTTSSWNFWFGLLEEFVEQEGHAMIPVSYKMGGNYRLGAWVNGQRTYRSKLTSERESRLEAIDGWVWDTRDAAWEMGLLNLIRHIEQGGDANLSGSYKTDDGYRLGQWIGHQRSAKEKLSDEKISKLESVKGWVWNTFEASWEEGLLHLSNYIEAEGHANIPSTFITEGGYMLGKRVVMLRSMRKKGKMSPERESELESLNGWVWDTNAAAWEKGFSYLAEYVKREAHSKVNWKYKTSDGFKLGQWVLSQRTRRSNLTPEQEMKMEALDGWVWDTHIAAWEDSFSYLVRYVEQEGHAKVPRSYITKEGYKLGAWINKQRNERNKLTTERISRLESLAGWAWNAREVAWEEGFSYLSEYVEQTGQVKVPQLHRTEDGYKLGQWLNVQKTKREKLSPERKERLESLGFVWEG